MKDLESKTASIASDSKLEKAISPAEEEYGPTDGGLKAWLTIVGCSFVGFCTFGYVLSMQTSPREAERFA